MFRPKPLRPPFDPFLGQPHKLPPTPTLRQLQMQAAHRGRGPGGWQTGGSVGTPAPSVPSGLPHIDASAPAGRRAAAALNQYMGGIGVRKIGTAEAKEAWANRARRQASRSPGGWQGGGSVRGFAQGDLVEINKMREAINQLDPTIAIPYEGEDDPRWKWDQKQKLMAEREMLQQQLQMADEVTAQEIMAQIMELHKELEMEARNFGMAGGGLASLMGG